jgi:predicted ATP-grasp superfamily ATP-dependent carboligase
LLGVTAALGRATPTHPALYAGAVGPLPLDEETEATLRRLGTVAAKRLNLRGLFNIDLVRHPVHGWFLLELNLRYSASMELLDSRGVGPTAGPSLIGRHLNAFGYRLPPSATSNLDDGPPASGPVRCKRVLYAPATLPMQARLFARLERLIRTHRAGWADLPMEGTKIAAGAPFCTILTSGQSEHDARQQAAEVSRAFEKTLRDASQAGS